MTRITSVVKKLPEPLLTTENTEITARRSGKKRLSHSRRDTPQTCHPERERGTWVAGVVRSSCCAPPTPQVPRSTLGMTCFGVRDARFYDRWDEIFAAREDLRK
jgi:hypothetical protein